MAKRSTTSESVVTFTVAPGGPVAKRDAGLVGRELMRIRAAGELTPEAVLHEARDPRSPLHRYFTWNDKKAAHAYRVHEARQLMRTIDIVLEDAKGKQVPMRAFHPVNADGKGRRWEPTSYVFESRELGDQVVERARAELVGWTERYEKYQWARESMRYAKQAAKFLAKRKGGRVETKRVKRKAA